jgi:hypothetical protein
MCTWHLKDIGLHALLTVSLLAGVSASSSSANETSPHQAYLNGGYYLLHTLGNDEAQLPLILVVKSAPPEIKTYADRISRLAKETVSDLDTMQDHDPALDLDKNPLPSVEQDVRDSIKGDKQHQLLMEAQGDEFIRVLVISQIEASSYARNLATVLADKETDSHRARVLRQLSEKWLQVRKDSYSLLRNY